MNSVVTGYQGKIQAGWIPPVYGPTSAYNKVAKLVYHEIDEILESAKQKARSDSFPMESPPQATEVPAWTQTRKMQQWDQQWDQQVE